MIKNVDTLEYNEENGKWSFLSASDEDFQQLFPSLNFEKPIFCIKDNELSEFTARNQFTHSLRVYEANNSSKALLFLIDPIIKSGRKPKDGCRAAGLILSVLLKTFPDIAKIPSTIYVKSTGGFQSRGLITLKQIGAPLERHSFINSFSTVFIENPRDQKGWKSYEEYTLDKINRDHDWNCKKLNKLGLPGFQRVIETDGYDNEKQVILEIKKGMSPNVTEGLSELIQYFGILRENLKVFSNHENVKITTRLITSKNEKDVIFEKGINFFKSDHKICFLCQEEACSI